MHVFVTVGSTKFDALVQAVLSPRILSVLRTRGCTSLTIQCGNSIFSYSSSVTEGKTTNLQLEGIEIDIWKFKPSLHEEYEKADLIISHAGSGTIIEILRMPKPLIVVPNSTLLHNHQEELANALHDPGYLKSSNIENLAQSIEEFDGSQLLPFPAFDGNKFRELLDREMGFI